MKTKKLKRGLAIILYILLTASIVNLPVVAAESTMQTEEGVTSRKNMINLGTNGITDPVVPKKWEDTWQGSYVYWGIYDGNPVKYRVLDSNTTDFGGNTMLLDCDSVLWQGTNSEGQYSAFDEKCNVWEDSTIRAYLNGAFLTNYFSTQERSAIAESTKNKLSDTDGNGSKILNYCSLERDKIFLLDAKEATNTSYGYYNIDYFITSRIKYLGNTEDPSCWWLRSAYGDESAGVVGKEGNISTTDVQNYDLVGVSPSCNISLSSILFSSAIGADKTSVLTRDSDMIGTTTETEWKLTVSDAGKKIQIAGNGMAVCASDGMITVPYTYTDSAESDEEKVNQISVMITDKAYTESSAQILYYGTLQNTKFDETSGIGTFELPSDLDGKKFGEDYHIYVLAEHVNKTNATDYASTPEEITKTCEEVRSAAVNVTEPVGGKPLDTAPIIVSSNISNAQITWIVEDGNTVTGNALNSTVHTAHITLTAVDGYGFTNCTGVTVNGEPATIIKNSGQTITISYTFPKTEEGVLRYNATGYEGTYDGQEHGIIVEAKDSTNAKISYSTDVGENKTYSINNPTFTDVGEYTVYYKVEYEDDIEIKGSQKVSIIKRNITIITNEQCILYDDKISQDDYIIGDGELVTGDTLTCSLEPSTMTLTDDGTVNVSNVKVVNSLEKDVTNNYKIDYVTGRLVIYAESRVISDDITINYKPYSDSSVRISLLGNSFLKLTDGDNNSIPQDCYIVRNIRDRKYIEIILTNSYLDTLNVGSYTYKVYTNPQGLETSKGPLVCTFTVNVNKETPVIAEVPVTKAITYGEALTSSSLTGGKMQHNSEDDITVEGSFTWKDANVKPTVADSEKTEYTVIFTPTDIDNYNVVEIPLCITVNKAENIPNIPDNIMSVPYDIDKVSAVELPIGWKWQDEDVNKELTVGTAVTAIAVYEGTDKGNYEDEIVSVSITRNECEHTWDSGKVTMEATENKEGVKTYTCTVCGKTKTEVIPKKESVPQQPTEGSTVSQSPKNGDTITDNKSNAKYTVTDTVKKNVTYIAPVTIKAKTITIPATIKINGEIYKVTRIDKNALKGNKKVTKIVVGSNIQSIGDYAFSGCKKLKTIIIQSKKLTTKTVSKKAFKGISKKVVVKVPNKKRTAYKKLLKKKGLSSKNRIKNY